MSKPALIGVDWGTSSLRLWRFRADGSVSDTKRSDQGIMNVGEGRFRPVFEAAAGAWLEPGVPILMCGMVGSRQGWAEASYAFCPAEVATLADHLKPVPGYPNAFIVPGVAVRAADGRRDVMRGEETQILGAASGPGRHLIVLPGTHSKWVIVENGCIRTFHTFMTGELYSLLRHHSILARLMPQSDAEVDEAAFETAVRGALDGAAAVMQSLFAIRARGLFAELAPEQAASSLSGLLIGAELREGLALARPLGVDHVAPWVIGSSALAQRYAQAFAVAGFRVRTEDEGASMRGLWAIARQRGLV
ncbi:MAG TPA: 2-dehydro-3-deoxygalactonokinase [Beijerinckiaceae bacterium]|nr:2-dehydro-3-deoxygalactonokinase [Beijerinckiaceae bacterium]